jgi:hypothetical protein
MNINRPIKETQMRYRNRKLVFPAFQEIGDGDTAVASNEFEDALVNYAPMALS